MSDGFLTRKKTILVALNSDTPDKSPKGYVDEPLLPLIVLINNHQDYVTTSSCSGRICTYLEGLESSTDETVTETDSGETKDEQDQDDDEEEEASKGYEENTSLAAVEAAKRAKGGQWLYVSHDPVVFPDQVSQQKDSRWIVEMLFGPEAHRVVTMEEQEGKEGMRTIDMARSQLVYFKFEPMILHIEAATPGAAKTFLNHSLFSGYRNSGILPSTKRTMLAIRSTLKLDAPIAYIPSSTSSSTTGSTTGTGEEKIYLMVSLSYLRVLIDLSNDKFRMNVAQMARFEERLTKHLLTAENVTPKKVGDQGGEWEDKEARKERKRREGMLKQEETAKARAEKKKAAAEAAAEAARKAAADAAAAGTGPTAAKTTEDKTATIS
ncbi:methyltransferase TYW3-domain-containing protein [Linnemannia elongata]|nr:methyltransferase TYW3-domain-containing protein [Linnemannia elongata]